MRLFVFLVALAVVLGAIGSQAAVRDREVYIFRGTPLAQSGMSAGSWGSGKAIESADSTKVLTGSKSIKITTQGLFSGGRIDFAQPVSLSGEGEGTDANRYMIFSFYFDDVQRIDPGAGTFDSYDIEPYDMPRAGMVRFVLISDKGTSVAVEEFTNPLDPDDNWCRISVPLSKLKSGEGALDFKLKRLLIFTDLPTNLYLGEIKIVSDDTPIKVESLPTQMVIVYDEVLFPAKASGGVSSLRYSWDYDSSNGIQQEATGPVGKYVYTKGGDFTVTLTVSDADNLKKPVTVTTVVSVND